MALISDAGDVLPEDFHSLLDCLLTVWASIPARESVLNRYRTRCAGMPLISDPGSGLVAAAAAAGHQVIPIAGPSAFLLALVASGLSSSRFTFVGFLPEKAKARKLELQKLAGHPTLVVLSYSASHIPVGSCAI